MIGETGMKDKINRVLALITATVLATGFALFSIWVFGKILTALLTLIGV